MVKQSTGKVTETYMPVENPTMDDKLAIALKSSDSMNQEPKNINLELINELRDKWQEFLSASISAKYGNSEKDTKEMIEKLEEFDKFWEVFKNEQSRDRERHSGETENPGI